MKLNGCIITENQIYFALVETADCEDDDAYVCSGQIDEEELRLRRITPKEEFVSIQPTSAPWDEICDAVALTAQGSIFYLRKDGATSEVVPGTGYEEPGALGLGRLTSVKQINERLFVLGYGGQVYARSHTGEWEGLHIPTGQIEAGVDACLYDVVEGPESCLYFCGSDITKFERTPELIAADEADDEDLWLELLLAAPSGNQMSLRKYDGAWTDLGFELNGALNIAVATPRGEWALFSNIGVAWRTEDFLSVDELLALPNDQKFWDIKKIGNAILILVGQQLSEFIDGEMVPFAPPLPTTQEGYINLSGNSRCIIGCEENGIRIFQDETWSDTVPAELSAV
jgi:hypothetical protein